MDAKRSSRASLDSSMLSLPLLARSPTRFLVYEDKMLASHQVECRRRRAMRQLLSLRLAAVVGNGVQTLDDGRQLAPREDTSTLCVTALAQNHKHQDLRARCGPKPRSARLALPANRRLLLQRAASRPAAPPLRQPAAASAAAGSAAHKLASSA